MGMSVRTSLILMGYQGAEGAGQQVRRMEIVWRGGREDPGRDRSWGDDCPPLPGQAMSLCVEIPAVPEALLSWEPQLGTPAPGSLLGCSDSTWQPHSACAQ